jgi:hypothetical protein
MSGSAFVAREIELNKLKTFLDAASTGQTQIVFIAREAGAEDPSLNTEYTAMWQKQTPLRSLHWVSAIPRSARLTQISHSTRSLCTPTEDGCDSTNLRIAIYQSFKLQREKK